MPNIKGYIDISDFYYENQTNSFTEEPTDIKEAQDSIPKFDARNNVWVIPDMGISYNCLTMQQINHSPELSA